MCLIYKSKFLYIYHAMHINISCKKRDVLFFRETMHNDQHKKLWCNNVVFIYFFLTNISSIISATNISCSSVIIDNKSREKNNILSISPLKRLLANEWFFCPRKTCKLREYISHTHSGPCSWYAIYLILYGLELGPKFII